MDGRVNTPEEDERADAILAELKAAEPSIVERLKTAIKEYGKDGEQANPEMERYAQKVLTGIERERRDRRTARARELKRRRAAKRARKMTRATRK